MAIQDMVVNFVVKPTRSVVSITGKLCLFQALVYHYVGNVGQLFHKRKFDIELALAEKTRMITSISSSEAIWNFKKYAWTSENHVSP